MYDRRAIMNSSHRLYEAQADRLRSWVIERNGHALKSRSARRPMLLDLGKQLSILWRNCLRHAWADAKRAACPVAPLDPLGRVLMALAYEESTERGYRAEVVAGLRAELRALAA